MRRLQTARIAAHEQAHNTGTIIQAPWILGHPDKNVFIVAEVQGPRPCYSPCGCPLICASLNIHTAQCHGHEVWYCRTLRVTSDFTHGVKPQTSRNIAKPPSCLRHTTWVCCHTWHTLCTATYCTSSAPFAKLQCLLFCFTIFLSLTPTLMAAERPCKVLAWPVGSIWGSCSTLEEPLTLPWEDNPF